jgi:hypothetical protein
VVALANHHRISGNPWDLERLNCKLDTVLADQTDVKSEGEVCSPLFLFDNNLGQRSSPGGNHA